MLSQGGSGERRRSPRLQLSSLGYLLLALAVCFSIFCGIRAVLLSQQQRHLQQHRLLRTGTAWSEETQSIHAVQQSGQPCPQCADCKEADTPPKIVSTAAYVQNPRAYHVVTTTQGFSNHWQARIHYYWYKKQRAICHAAGVCDMGGFTRLLHSGVADDLMDEIPTVVVSPLPKTAFGEGDTSYIVLNRPYAFMEWLKIASIPERYMVMCEADHLWMRPMPNMMPGEAQGAALFTYINPKEYPDIVRSFIGNVPDSELELVPRIGNSPTFISIRDFKKLAPYWYNTTMDIFKDDKAHKAWNWVLEMYGYSLATYRAGLHKGLETYEQMLAHPPFDKTELDFKGRPFYLLHLTYPLRYNSTGGMTDDEKQIAWKFDKRAFSEKPPQRSLEDPPAFVDNALARLIIRMFNEATDAIPCWDEYVAHKVVTTACAPATSTDASQP